MRVPLTNAELITEVIPRRCSNSGPERILVLVNECAQPRTLAFATANTGTRELHGVHTRDSGNRTGDRLRNGRVSGEIGSFGAAIYSVR